ncbi:V-set and immunoglobulin domain-containing protein 10-like 2 [Leucoraja erinacea]|uniref:V-set and immunoglobulin domain-containing protein 10-like 2 n=1 Tax=Leucoraja erinaceus TaxID=7782 RepID=UPI002454BF76|nr:V-set and immunoglobulin domain-containing protein 10-like 2 [Leucoraja erinacea]
MAAADLLVIIIDLILRHIPIVFRGLFQFVDSLHVCNIHASFLFAASDCSVWFTVSFTFDRFVSICCQKLKTKHCTGKMAAAVLGTVTALSCLKNISWYFMLSGQYWLLNNPWFWLVILDPEEVTYIEVEVKGVIGRSVVLECGQSLPTIYIWGFTRPGSSGIRAVLYDYGMGAKLQKMASAFGEVKVLSDSASLVIANLQLAAEGRFTCQSLYDSNDGARLVYIYVDLHVLVPITNPSIQMSTSAPVEGSTVSILCSVENGTGPLEYTWSRQATLSRSPVNISQTDSSLLNLTTVNRNHTGWYTCSARNEVNEASSNRVWLDVIYGPDQPAINITPYSLNSVGYSAIEQDTVSMICSAPSNPPSQYVWFHNNSQVYAGQQFVIERISQSQTGTYMCLAHNTVLNTRTKSAILLTVYCEYSREPKQELILMLIKNWNILMIETNVICAHELQLEDEGPSSHKPWFAHLTGGDPAATLRWVNPLSGSIDAEGRSSVSRVIQGQEMAHNSTYACRPSHPALRADWSCKTTALLPEGRPTCTATSVKSLVYTMLSCSWEGGLPQASLQWTDWRSVFLGKAERSINNQVLKSSPAYNGKQFICQATHPLTRKAPNLLTLRNAVTVFEGSDVHMTCVLKAAYPASEIAWHNNRNESIWLRPKKYQLHHEAFWSNLTIRETDGDVDNGTYWCTAVNVVGSATMGIKLRVNSESAFPHRLALCVFLMALHAVVQQVIVPLPLTEYPTPPNVTISKLLYSRQRTEVDLEWITRGVGDLTGFMVQRRPARRSLAGRATGNLKESIIDPHIPWQVVANAIDPAVRGHKLGGMDPRVLYAFRILAVNHRTTGYPSEVKTPADPPFSALPAVIGAAVVGMLVAVAGTMLMFRYVIRNRENIPWLHDLLFQHELQEQINLPEDAEVALPSEGDDPEVALPSEGQDAEASREQAEESSPGASGEEAGTAEATIEPSVNDEQDEAAATEPPAS